MSYWSKNPELLDEVTIKCLPDEWREKVDSGEIELDAVPEKIRDKAMDEGVEDYWATRIDEATQRHKEERRNDL